MPTLYNPTRRRTQAHIVNVNGADYYFSYRTCIAYDGKKGRFRITNHWGPTTGRHFNEMGCGDFEIIDDDAFAKIVA